MPQVISIEGERVWFRLNGWTWPPACPQVGLWLFAAVLCTVQFGGLAAYPPMHYRAGVYVISAVLFTLFVVLMFIATNIDPTDENVLSSRQRSGWKPRLRRERTDRPVIHENFCHLCRSPVRDDRTKHCKACNRCTSGFDHHCVWLNNCVGRNNYRYFIMALIAGILSLTIILSNSIYVIVKNKTNSNGQTLEFFDKESQVVGVRASDSAVTAVAWTSLGLSVIALIALFHLAFFHVYLAYLKMTTIEFVISRRLRTKNSSACCPISHHKPNRVQPSHSLQTTVDPPKATLPTSAWATQRAQQTSSSGDSEDVADGRPAGGLLLSELSVDQELREDAQHAQVSLPTDTAHHDSKCSSTKKPTERISNQNWSDSSEELLTFVSVSATRTATAGGPRNKEVAAGPPGSTAIKTPPIPSSELIRSPENLNSEQLQPADDEINAPGTLSPPPEKLILTEKQLQGKEKKVADRRRSSKKRQRTVHAPRTLPPLRTSSSEGSTSAIADILQLSAV